MVREKRAAQEKLDPLFELQEKTWRPVARRDHQVVQALEMGQVLYLPQLVFDVSADECPYISEQYLAEGKKNISFDPKIGLTKGIAGGERPQAVLSHMIECFAAQARTLVEGLLPEYTDHLVQGRTSYRPAEAQGRPSSYRKDDRRLHVDAFPSTPNRGRRLLRVFSNINPDGKPRVWRLGEPFEEVAQHFLPQISKPFPGSHALLNLLGITKTKRSDYDHYMLRIHDAMKADMGYQERADQITMEFPSGATWIVMTDQVSHAAMSGQHMLEQTFYLPVEGLYNPETSPLSTLERLLGRPLA